MLSLYKIIFGESHSWKRRIIKRGVRYGIPMLFVLVSLYLLPQYPSLEMGLSLMCISAFGLINLNYLYNSIEDRNHRKYYWLYQPSLSFTYWVSTSNFFSRFLGYSPMMIEFLSGLGGGCYINYLILKGEI